MKIHRLVFGVLGLASAVSVAWCGTFSIEPGYSEVRVSGIRSYAAKQNLSHNDTSHVGGPSLRLAYTAVDTWSFGVGYMDYTQLLGSGISPNGDIYNDGTPSIQILVPVASNERVRELAFDARYRVKIAQNLRVEVGPVVSWFKSRAEIWPVYPSATLVAGSHFPGRFYSASELKVGAVAGLRWTFTPGWSLTASWRYAAPTERTFQIVSASLGYAF